MRKKIYVSIAAVLIGISLFYSGVKYGESKKTTAFSGNMGARLNGSGFQNGTKNQGGGMIMGEIISKDEESITVKLQTGGSKIIIDVDDLDHGYRRGAMASIASGPMAPVATCLVCVAKTGPIFT